VVNAAAIGVQPGQRHQTAASRHLDILRAAKRAETKVASPDDGEVLCPTAMKSQTSIHFDQKRGRVVIPSCRLEGKAGTDLVAWSLGRPSVGIVRDIGRSCRICQNRAE